MRKYFIGIILAIATCIAFAMPSPQQIENSLAGGNPAYARSAIQEVLIDKPNSGKAHLLNAYLLAHYDLNNSAANAELIKATTLEPALTNTPLFGRVVDELDTHKQIHVVPTPVVATTYIRSNEEEKAAMYVLIGCLCLGVVMLIVLSWIWYSNRNVVSGIPPMPRVAPPPRSTILADRGTDRRFPYSRSSPAVITPAPVSSAPSAMKTALAVGGGVLAAELIADQFRHNQGHDFSHDYSQDHYSSDSSSSWDSGSSDSGW